MEYNEDFLKKMVQVGTLGYPLSKIINVLDIEDQKQFTKDFDNPKSKIAVAYQKGVDKANRLDKMNLHLIACEIDKEYIDKAIKRISESIKQGTLSF